MTSYSKIKSTFIIDSCLPSNLTLKELKNALKQSFDDEKSECFFTNQPLRFYCDFQYAIFKAIESAEEQEMQERQHSSLSFEETVCILVQKLGYKVRKAYDPGVHCEIVADCGCSACDDGVEPGHFACLISDERMIALEEAGLVCRSYNQGEWVWEILKGEPHLED